MVKSYSLTWIQNGRLETFYFSSNDISIVLDVYLDIGCGYMTDACFNNRLYCNGRLIARQATYQGV